MDKLIIEWKHLDLDGETCERCSDTGENIVKAILAQPAKDKIKLVYIGTVAETGDRNPPIHWGRTGDPLKISIYDNYARTKAIAERIIIESGVKYWVSLRQTGVLYFDILIMI